MIRDLLGIMVEAETLTDSDTYVGYCIDMAAATHELPGATPLWLTVSNTVAAEYGNSDETYQIQFRTGTGTDGTDINAGAKTIFETPLIAGNDARMASAGAFMLRIGLAYEAHSQRYWQLYYAEVGTTSSITINASLTPWAPRTDFNISVNESNVGLP